MRSPRVVKCSIAIAIAVAALAGWYARPFWGSGLVGVDWWAAMRQCVGAPRLRICGTSRRRGSAVTFTTLEFSPLTRRLVEVSWNVVDSDSTRWMARVDSARKALHALHEPPLPCVSPLRGALIDGAWAVGGREVRLWSRWNRFGSGAKPYGRVSAELVPRGTLECDRARRVVWLTPDQFARGVRLWVEDHLGF